MLPKPARPCTSNPIGTGPFKFVSYSPDQELILDANKDYYEPGIPKVDQLDIKYYLDDTERANALLGGSIDFATRVGAKDYDGIIATDGFAGTEQVGGRWFWIMTQDKDAADRQSSGASGNLLRDRPAGDGRHPVLRSRQADSRRTYPRLELGL